MVPLAWGSNRLPAGYRMVIACLARQDSKGTLRRVIEELDNLVLLQVAHVFSVPSQKKSRSRKFNEPGSRVFD